MLVVISVNRMDSNGVQVWVARPQHNATSVQTYPSEAAARAVLLGFGIAEKVLDDSLKLLPQLGANQPLKFPPLDVPQHELLEKGFRACARNASGADACFPLLRQHCSHASNSKWGHF